MTQDEKRNTAIELKMLMSVAWKTTTLAYEQWLTREGIDLSGLQSAVLRMVAHERTNTISELSKRFAIDPSTLVPTVDALERKSFLIRQRDPADRRRVLLSLTEDGQALVARLPHLIEDDPLLDGIEALGEEKTMQLIELLSLLVSAMPEGVQLLHNALPRLLASGLKEENLLCKQFIQRRP
jgi:DNA-binding MarR family transcriptional regulator